MMTVFQTKFLHTIIYFITCRSNLYILCNKQQPDICETVTTLSKHNVCTTVKRSTFGWWICKYTPIIDNCYFKRLYNTVVSAERADNYIFDFNCNTPGIK